MLDELAYSDHQGLQAVAVTDETYLDADKLRVLDVLLVRSKGFFSKMITLATKGPFSHALAVLNPGYAVESIKKRGVDYLHLDPQLFWIASKPRSLVRLSDFDWKLVSLWRHPGLTLPDPQDPPKYHPSPQGLSDLISSVLTEDYATIKHLLEAFSGPPDLNVERFARLLRAREHTNPGLFCSELVALCFEAVNLPATSRSTKRTFPNDLGRPGSTNLQVVEGAFLRVPPGKIERHTRHEATEAEELHTTVSNLKQLKQTVDRFEKQVAIFLGDSSR